jgi:hypothetical protein
MKPPATDPGNATKGRSTPLLESLDADLSRLEDSSSHLRALWLKARKQVEQRDGDLQQAIRRLQDSVQTQGQRIGEGTQERTSASATYRELVARVREIVQVAVPPQSTVLVVSKGDEQLIDLEGREGWHFPRDDRGVYAGYHPAESADAIRGLERACEQGARYLVLPRTGFWWLDYYRELRGYLDARSRRVWADRSCLIYQFDRTSPHEDHKHPERRSGGHNLIARAAHWRWA